MQDFDKIEKLTEEQFDVLFCELHKQIMRDPIKNFVEAKGFINMKLTTGQRVLIKLVMGQELDSETKFSVFQEDLGKEEFQLITTQMTEVELYEYYTEKEYDFKSILTIRDISLIVGRRGGKCLAEGTLVKTPTGSKKIEDIKVGDLVYGYNADGTVSLTEVIGTHDQGIKDVVDLVRNREVMATCTKEHRWLAHDWRSGKRRVKEIKKFTNKLDGIAREYTEISGGTKEITEAYALGALLGDGCCPLREGVVEISSADVSVVDKVARLLRVEHSSENKNNYSWRLKRVDKDSVPFYREWLDGRHSYDKICDLEEIRTWNRTSQLEFLAGLIDTDGGVRFNKKHNRMSIGLDMQAKIVVEAAQALFLDLFSVSLKIYVDNRAKYKNGPVYRLRYNNNDAIRILKELTAYLVCDRKKYRPEFDAIDPHNSNVKYAGVKMKNPRKEHCYDLTLNNDTHLYLLANGLVTHNTQIASILAVYAALKENWKAQLGRKKVATILVLSQSKEFSDETVSEIRAIIEDSPALCRLVNKHAKNTFNVINLKVPFRDEKGRISYSFVRIRTNAASSKSSRGSACPCIINDEIAFWGAEMDSKETAKSIVRALKPSMLQFGKQGLWIEISTPNAKSGYFYEKYEKRDEFSTKYLILKSPSWVFNDRYDPEEYKDEHKEDPTNFDREYRANFLQSISNFFNIASIDQAIMLGTSVVPPASKLQGVRYICSIDSAFKGDRFTVNIVGKLGNRIKQFATVGFHGTPKAPVKAFEVAKVIRELNKQYDFDQIFADQFSYNPLREIFAQFNLVLTEITWNNMFKQKIYKNLKYLTDSQLIDLLDHVPTIKEIKELQVEVSSTGKIRIGHPAGGHDDYCFHPATLIRTINGHKRITDIKRGDLVLTHNGRFKPVLDVSEVPFNGYLKKIRSFGNLDVMITDNHPVLANIPFYGTGDKKEYIQYKWVDLQNWKKSYKTVTPRYVENTRLKYNEFEIGANNLTKVNSIKIDKMMSFILGYFLGDGWAAKDGEKSHYRCNLAFNAKKDGRLCRILQKFLLKIGINSQIQVHRNCLILNFHSKVIWNLFSKCYSFESEKVLPSFFEDYSFRNKYVLYGWLKADSCRTRNYRVGATTSKELALSMRELAIREGYHTNISQCTRHRYEKKTKDQYWITLYRPQDVSEVSLNSKNTFDGKYVASKINKNEDFQYNGFVYNLSVEEDNSYVANGYVVHNCASLAMGVYILTQSEGLIESDVEAVSLEKTYGIQRDIAGKCFSAPPPELLDEELGYSVLDNSADYAKDPKTGLLVRVEELEEAEFEGSDDDDSGTVV